jgi:Zn-dependent protease with chaperone function
MRPSLVVAVVFLVMIGSAYLLGPATPAPALPSELVEDAAWLQRAEEIGQLRLLLTSAELVLLPAALWIFVSRGWSARLRRRLVERGLRNQWLLVGGYTLILVAGLALVQLPLAYAAYFMRRSYGLTPESPTAWLVRYAAETGVAALLALVAAEGLYWLLRLFPRRWWIGASLGYVALSLLLAYLQPLVVTPLFFSQRPLADADLRARIMQMAAHIGVPVNEVYVIDASKQGNEGNAYFAGVGDSTRIVLYDTLLAEYPTDELLGILGHEMGHWRERHIWKSLALSWLFAPLGLLAAYVVLQALLPRWGIRSPSDVAGLPFLLLLGTLVTIAMLPMQSWQSRRWEAQADRIAVAATGDPAALARTFVRLSQQNLADPTPPRLVEGLWMSHPALGRRVAYLLEGPDGP